MAEMNFTCPSCGIDIEVDESFGGHTAQCPQCNNTVMIPMPGIKSGVQIDGFRIEKRLGVGGMGEVWLAVQESMDRQVALKILSPALTNDEDFVNRFLSEVKTTAKLVHPNIVTAYDAGMANGIYYLAMQFVEGRELDDYLDGEEPVDEEWSLKVIHDIAESLKYAWNKFKILHRDIKPANIMLDKESTPMLMDMGISKSLEENANLTITGMIVGTPYYMSPEQAKADVDLDFRADLYSLGATLYHLVTGSVPYDSTTAMGILSKHITDPFPSPLERNPRLSEPCCALLEIMMAKRRDDRPESWEALISDINKVLKGKFPGSRRPAAGKSLIMQDTASQALKKRSAVKLPPKAKRVKHSEPSGKVKKVQHKTPSASSSKTGLIIAVCVVLVLSILGISLFMIKTAAKRKEKSEKTEKKSKLNSLKPEKHKIESSQKPEKEKKILRPSKQQQQKKQKLIEKKKEKINVAWQNVLNFAKQNPDKPEKTIEQFDRFIRDYRESAFAKLAENEIARIKNKMKISHKPAERDKNHHDFKDKKEKVHVPDLKIDSEVSAKDNKFEPYLKLSECLFRGKIRSAFKEYEKIPNKYKNKKIAEILEKLKKLPEILIETFKKDKGKIIDIELTDGKTKLKILDVKGYRIRVQRKAGKVYATKSISLRNLSKNEKLNRLSAAGPEPKAIYMMSKLKKASHKNLKNLIEKTGAFKEILQYALDKKIAEHKEILAEKVFKAIKEKASPEKLKQNQRYELEELLSKFDKNFAGTECALKNADFIKKLKDKHFDDSEIAVAAGNVKEILSSVLNGKLISFNSDTRELELLYEFDDPRETRDWRRVNMPDNNGNIFIRDGALLMRSKGRGAFELEPEFSEIQIVYEGRCKRSFCEFIVSENNHLLLFFPGKIPHRYGYVYNWNEHNERVQELGDFHRTRPNQVIKKKLQWKNGKLKFAGEDKLYPPLDFQSDSIRFGICTRNSSNIYEYIRIKGVLDEKWLEEALKNSRESGRNEHAFQNENRDMNFNNPEKPFIDETGVEYPVKAVKPPDIDSSTWRWIKKARENTGRMIKCSPDGRNGLPTPWQVVPKLKSGDILHLSSGHYNGNEIFIQKDEITLEAEPGVRINGIRFEGDDNIVRGVKMNGPLHVRGEITIIDSKIELVMAEGGEIKLFNSVCGLELNGPQKSEAVNCTIVRNFQENNQAMGAMHPPEMAALMIEKDVKIEIKNSIIFSVSDLIRASRQAKKIKLENCLVSSEKGQLCTITKDGLHTSYKTFNSLKKIKRYIKSRDCENSKPRFLAYEDRNHINNEFGERQPQHFVPTCDFNFKLETNSPGTRKNAPDLGANLDEHGIPVPYEAK